MSVINEHVPLRFGDTSGSYARIVTVDETERPGITFKFEMNLGPIPEFIKGKEEGYAEIGFVTSGTLFNPVKNSFMFKARAASFTTFDESIQVNFVPKDFPDKYDPYHEPFIERLQCIITLEHWDKIKIRLSLDDEYLFIIQLNVYSDKDQ